ncbi:MAG: hypothetical protein NWQ09_06370 [Nonlabens sp.]|nr:hypothetical protein [Nonlabens sp.]
MAQNIITDIDTKKPIPFARYEYADIRGYADLNGLINVNLQKNDTLKLYALGFEKKLVVKDEVLSRKNLFMFSKIEKLDTVTLQMYRSKKILEAGTESKRNGFRRFPIGYESRYLIELTPVDLSKSLRIDNIRFFFSDLKQESRYAKKEGKQFALKFSVLNQDFETIHEQLYLSKTGNFENTVDFDFSKTRVFIESETLYIVIENLGDLNDDGSFSNFKRSIMLLLTEKVFNQFNLKSFLASATNARQELVPLTNIFHNAYKDGDIKAPTGLPPTEVYNLNPMMEFTVTEY